MTRNGALLLLVLVAAQGGSSVTAATATVPAKGLLLVANKADRTLSVIDPAAGKAVATVAESGTTGHEVIASPDGKTAYVPIYGDSGVGRAGSDGQTIDVVDLASGKRVATIDLGGPERPHCPKFGPDGKLYVTTEVSKTVTVIDPKTNKVEARIPTDQPESHMLVITRDGKRGYTSNVGPGTISVLDLAGRKVVKVIKVSAKAQRIALSTDDKWVFTADQTEPRLAVIDTSTNEVARWVALPGLAFGTAPTPDGRFLVVTMSAISKVAVLDLKSMELVKTLDVPKAPQEVVVQPDGALAYVSCDTAKQVAVIDTKEWKVARFLDAGDGADGLAWAARP